MEWGLLVQRTLNSTRSDILRCRLTDTSPKQPFDAFQNPNCVPTDNRYPMIHIIEHSQGTLGTPLIASNPFD